MKLKILVLFGLFLLPFAWSEGRLLQAGTKKVWTVQEAREEVFRGAQGIIDTWDYPSRDPNYSQNLKAIAQKQSVVSSRKITVFDNNSYAVVPECSLESRYYEPSGELYLIEFASTSGYSTTSCKDSFPNKSLRYNFPEGQLIQASFSVEPGNDYLYQADGSFICHWVGSHCYEEDGSNCGYRRSFIRKSVSSPK